MIATCGLRALSLALMPRLRAALCMPACGLLLAGSAGATSATDIVVSRIVDAGGEVATVDGPLKVQLRAASGAVTHHLQRGQVLAPLTQLSAGAGVTIELARTDPRLQLRVEPRTRLTLVRSDADGAAVDLGEGRVSFSLSGRLGFFFGVTAFKQVLALARSTRFTVDARRHCDDRPGAPCVEVVLDEGRLNLETRRPLQVGTGAGAGSGSGPASAAAALQDDATVLVVDPMSAGESRSLSLAPEQFALRFDSNQAADTHYVAELERARAGAEPAAVLRALRNLLVVRRLADRHDDALALADEGLALAQRDGDRLWEFRFLIDRAFTTWRLRRDRSALDLFERAFAMSDVIEAADTRTDLGALYARYGNIRFEARDRLRPQADLDIAEALVRRSVQLREAAPGEPPTLDLSMSHYALGLLLRIGRDDPVQSNIHLQRALEIRRQVLGGRDDVSTAEMMSEAALTLERVVADASPTCPAEGAADPYQPARLLFDDSLAMLERLSPDRPYRSFAAVARRSADLRRRSGDWLLADCHAEAAAQAEFAAARSGYERSLAAWSVQPGNTRSERRFAWWGLGRTALRQRAWADADKALQQAYTLALDERCSTPPSPEAPSFDWVAGLLELRAQAAEGGGAPEAAAAHRRLRADLAGLCGAGGREAPR